MDDRDLRQLCRSLEEDCDTAFQIVVDGGYIKVRSRTATSRIFLVLGVHGESGDAAEGERFRLLKHRSVELTSRYGGKLVPRSWVVDFTKANRTEAQEIQDIAYSAVPDDCEVLKRTDVKVVVRDRLGTTITLWKDDKPQVSLAEYDGTNTRGWERQEDGVMNWHYDHDRVRF